MCCNMPFSLMRNIRTLIPILLGLLPPAAGAMEEEYLAEAEALEEHIEQVAEQSGPFSGDLFEPLMSLGRIRLSAGNHEEATDALRRAQNISHRNQGVYNLRQLEILRLLTNMSLLDEDHEAADRQQVFTFFITRRYFGEGDPALLPAYMEIADWYTYTGQTRKARKLLAEARELAARHNRNPLPLAIRFNRARRLESLCCNPEALIETLGAGDTTDPDTLAKAHLEIADTLILGRKADQARHWFLKAHETMPLLASSEPMPITIRKNLDDPGFFSVDAYRLQRNLFFGRQRLEKMTQREYLEDENREPHWFIMDGDLAHIGFIRRDNHGVSGGVQRTQSMTGHPILFSKKQLDNLRPFKSAGKSAGKKADLRITASFTVTETGDLENIEVVESNAHPRLNRLLVRTLKKVYYRPALEAGVPVRREQVNLIQTFVRDYKGV